MNTAFWSENELYVVIPNLSRDIDEKSCHSLKKIQRRQSQHLYDIPEARPSNFTQPQVPKSFLSLFSKKKELSLVTISVCIKNFRIFNIYGYNEVHPGKLLFQGNEYECMRFLKSFSQFTSWPLSAWVEGIVGRFALNSVLLEERTEFSLFKLTFLILRMNYDLTFRSRYKLEEAKTLLTDLGIPTVIQRKVTEFVGLQDKVAPKRDSLFSLDGKVVTKPRHPTILTWVPMGLPIGKNAEKVPAHTDCS